MKKAKEEALNDKFVFTVVAKMCQRFEVTSLRSSIFSAKGFASLSACFTQFFFVKSALNVIEMSSSSTLDYERMNNSAEE